MEEEKSWGWAMPDHLLRRTDLTDGEKLVVMILGRLGALEKPVHPRHDWIGEKIGKTGDAARHVLMSLEKKGMVKVVGRVWKIQQYSLTGEILHPVPEKSSGDSPEKSSTHNKTPQRKISHTEPSLAEPPKAASAGEREKDKKSAQVVEVFDTFRATGLWPIPNYGNRTQRKAAEELVDKFGLEKLLPMVERYAEALSSDRFMPKGHTPQLFRDNLGAIAARMKSNRPTGAIQSV